MKSIVQLKSISKHFVSRMSRSIQSSAPTNNGSSKISDTTTANSKIYEPPKTFTRPNNKESGIYKNTHTSSFGKGVDILDNFDGKRVSVKGYSETAFVINDVFVEQSVILLPYTMLLWKPRELKDITIESLSVFELVYPTIEVLFVGCGETMTQRFPAHIEKYFRDKGIVIEACDTANAASTFNVLSSEGRNVGAALLTFQPYNIEHELKSALLK